jgi:ribA/ribD-fused uncharacterized protein
MTINSFSGEHAFLSNFYPSKIYPNDIEYSTVEHAFQSAKTDDILAKELIRNAATPGEAKRLGRKVKLRENWNVIKLSVMLDLLRLKFSIPELKEKLLSTGDEELIEGNYWNDTFWGVCNGVGENHLGELLMKVRKEIQMLNSINLSYGDFE